METKEPEVEKKCPECGSDDVERGHHGESFALPECWYWFCYQCEHQWGHVVQMVNRQLNCLTGVWRNW